MKSITEIHSIYERESNEKKNIEKKNKKSHQNEVAIAIGNVVS